MSPFIFKPIILISQRRRKKLKERGEIEQILGQVEVALCLGRLALHTG